MVASSFVDAHVSLMIVVTTSHIMKAIRTIETAPAGGGDLMLMLATSSADGTVIVAITILRTHVVVI